MNLSTGVASLSLLVVSFCSYSAWHIYRMHRFEKTILRLFDLSSPGDVFLVHKKDKFKARVLFIKYQPRSGEPDWALYRDLQSSTEVRRCKPKIKFGALRGV